MDARKEYEKWLDYLKTQVNSPKKIIAENNVIADETQIEENNVSTDETQIEENNVMAESISELLSQMERLSDTEIENAFYKELSFGTGGLRGKLGPGTNRMNLFTVARATKGLAAYLLKNHVYGDKSQSENPSVVIGYDTRINSKLFADTAAKIFSENGIRVWQWNRPLPVPMVSYAVRKLHASCGVMITASHNPKEYNGYKVYGADGCQITKGAAKGILEKIQKEKYWEEDTGSTDLNVSPILDIPEQIYRDYLSEIRKQSVLYGDKAQKDISIVYTPLYGTGLEPVMDVLKQSGYNGIHTVKQQCMPDGHFPTCPKPNPEEADALQMAIDYAKKVHADLVLATDPDCDRVGIAIKENRNQNGAGIHQGIKRNHLETDGNRTHSEKEDYILLSGNETGILLLDYICSQRFRHGKMPENAYAVKTVVTTQLGEKIANAYGLKLENVLTGFKYIGEMIGRKEKTKQFIFGFEESYGYLSGDYVRDKDGVDAAFLICEMCAFYKAQGISLQQKLEQIYGIYGYCLNTQHTVLLEGKDGEFLMKEIMQALRHKPPFEMEDYAQGLYGLPQTEMLKFLVDADSFVVVRPSGTEPKLKLYFSVCAENQQGAKEKEEKLFTLISCYFPKHMGIG